MERRDLIRDRDWFAAIVGMFDDDVAVVVVVVGAWFPTSAIERRLFKCDVMVSETDGINAWMVLSWKFSISRFKTDASC